MKLKLFRKLISSGSVDLRKRTLDNDDRMFDFLNSFYT